VTATTRSTSVAIADLQPRTVARVEGRIVAIQIEPAGAAPTLIAHVEDATGRLDAVFMEGRVCVAQGRSRMYNPRYELQWRD